MGKRIGSKLLLTYFLILLIAFSITSVFYHLLSRQYLISETRKHLREEGEEVAKIVASMPILDMKNINERLNERIDERRQIIRAAGRFVDAEMIILNKDGRLVFRTAENKDSTILDILDKLDKAREKGYVVEKIPIVNKNNQVKGNVILYTEVNNVYELNRLMRRTQLLSFLIAGIVALMIGIIFEKSLTKPITLLMNKMKSYTSKKVITLPDIKTGDEIEQLDRSFTEMITKIKQYDEAQIKFLQNTSHELKTPLMSIQGYAEAIKDGVVEGQEAAEGLDIIIEQSQRLKRIVEEIVYLTKLENTEEMFRLDALNVFDCIKDAIRSIKPITDENSINVKLPNEFNCLGSYDYDKLTRAFINILGNAARYAKKSIVITVEESNTEVLIQVSDDGAGFKSGEESKIFERFYKGNKGNTGLGLSITKAIVEGHKGSIEAFNNTDGGASFIVKLPKSSKR